MRQIIGITLYCPWVGLSTRCPVTCAPDLLGLQC